MTKRAICLIAISILCYVIFVFLNSSYNARDMSQSNSDKSMTDIESKDSIRSAQKMSKILREIVNDKETLDSDVIAGYIANKSFTIAEIEIRVRLNILSGENRAIDLAVEALKYQAYLQEYARKHKIIVTENDINDYVMGQRMLIETSSEVNDEFIIFLKALEMTMDDYWNYVSKYEAPMAVLALKVDEYNRENNLSIIINKLAYQTIPVKITNMQFLKIYNEGKPYYK